MNKFHKKLIVAALATSLILTAGVSFAQGNGNVDKRQNHGPKLTYIFNQLELSAEQQASVEDVLKTFAEERRQKMSDQRNAVQDKADRPSREEMAVIREASKAEAMILLTDQLNTVLSPELTAELVEYLDAHQGMGNKHKGKKGSNDGYRKGAPEQSTNDNG